MSNSICIYNPASRSAPTPSRIRELSAKFQAAGYSVTFEPTKHPHHATELARNAAASKVDLVIACGGDGTINEVAAGLVFSQVPLAIVPTGTANVLARELRLPRDSLKAAAAIPSLRPRRIAVGRCGNDYFILMAGVGVDAVAIERVDPRWKARAGKLAFWFEGFRLWSEGSFPRLVVDVDGHRFTGTFAVISRVMRYGGSVRINPRADLLSDRFEVCIFTSGSRLDYLRYLAGVLTRTHHRYRDVVCTSGQSVEVSSDGPVRIQMDGELKGVTPARFEIVPNALTLLVPEYQ